MIPRISVLLLLMAGLSTHPSHAQSVTEARNQHRTFKDVYARVVSAVSPKKCGEALIAGDACLASIDRSPARRELDLQADRAIAAFEQVPGLLNLDSKEVDPLLSDRARREYLDLLIQSGNYCRFIAVAPETINSFMYVKADQDGSRTLRLRPQASIRNNRAYVLNGLSEFLFAAQKCDSLGNDVS